MGLQDVPSALVDVPDGLARIALNHREVKLIEPAIARHRARNAFFIDLLDALQRNLPLHRIDPTALLCDDNRCRVEKNGRPLYVDNNHLYAYGAISLLPLVKSITDSSRASVEKIGGAPARRAP